MHVVPRTKDGNGDQNIRTSTTGLLIIIASLDSQEIFMTTSLLTERLQISSLMLLESLQYLNDSVNIFICSIGYTPTHVWHLSHHGGV